MKIIEAPRAVATGGGSPAGYANVAANALRLGTTMPGVEFVQGNSSRVLSTLVDPTVGLNHDIGAGDFTWWVQLSVPASLSGNAAIGSLGPNNINAIPASDNAIAILQQNGDIELVLGNATNNTRYGLGLSGRTGQIVDITITRTGGSLEVYIDGALITITSANTGAGCLPGATFNTTFAMVGGAHSSGNPNAFAGIVYRFVTYNRRLSATEVASLVRFGVDISDQWGSKNRIVGFSPAVLNGGFETNSLNVAGTWNAGGLGSSTAAIDTSGTFSRTGTNALKWTLDSASSETSAFPSNAAQIMEAGRRYRISLWARKGATSGSAGVSIRPQAGNPVIATTGLTLTTSYQNLSVEYLSPVKQAVKLTQAPGSAGLAEIYIDDFELIPIGAFLDLSFEDIYGYQSPDRSSNELDGTLIGDAAFTLPGTKSGHARWTCGANGGTQLLGQRAIPPGAAIRTVFVENIDVAGTPTFSLGTTSGSAQIINAVTIGAAGTITQITPSALFSSNGNLWASWSAAGDVRVTVIYDRI